MKRVHLFFPENDLALARDLANYTPPPAASRLRRAGETLPLWYGADGDSFIATGVNASWLSGMQASFGMDVGVYDYNAAGCAAAPWGWSKASRRVYADRGFTTAQLPDDEALGRIRELSHRRSSAFIARRLAGIADCAPAAEELRSADEVMRFVSATGESLLKLPWSSSGRGLVKTDPTTAVAQQSMIEGMIKRQGSVMAEPFMIKTADFAMLFTMEHGRCRYDGLSLFSTDRLGSYTGNILAPQPVLASRIGHDSLPALRQALPPILEELIGTAYDGPLGIDMMTLADGRIAPAVELNLRMTMGHLCLRFAERYMAPEAEGRFAIVPRGEHAPGAEPMIRDARLHGGTLSLTPEGGDFVFEVSTM